MVDSVLFKKFVELKQGGRPVLEYVSEFEALSKYARSYIDSPSQKNEKFVTGLNTLFFFVNPVNGAAILEKSLINRR